jgi:hypothetical protein
LALVTNRPSMRRYGVHPIWLSDLLRAENDQVAGLLKQPDKQKLANWV